MPRSYDLTPAAHAQRKGAPHKHGHYAESVLRQVMPPCMKSKCPLGRDAFPCDVRRAYDDEGKTLELCPVALSEAENGLEELADAILEGDARPLAQGAALAIQLAQLLRDRTLVKVLRDGPTIDKPVYFDGREVGSVESQHPASWLLIELLKHTGATPDQQSVTPKSQGERDRDLSIAEALSWSAKKRRELEGARP